MLGSCENGEGRELGRQTMISFKRGACTRAAAGSPVDEPEVQRAAQAGERALPAACTHEPRDV